MVVEREELSRLASPKPGPIPPFCAGCGYNLTGAVSTRCPECGRTFVPREWEERAAELVYQGQQAREANEWANRGLYIALAAAVFTGLRFLLAGSCLSDAFRILATVCGVACAFLGLGTHRVERLPEWVGPEIAPQPNRELGTILFVAGVLLAAAVFLP